MNSEITHSDESPSFYTKPGEQRDVIVVNVDIACINHTCLNGYIQWWSDLRALGVLGCARFITHKNLEFRGVLKQIFTL